MPVYEYKCNTCQKRFEVFHKTVTKIDEVNCPECNSKDIKKLLSGFSAKVTNISGVYGCHNGSCDPGVSGSCCSSGNCGKH